MKFNLSEKIEESEGMKFIRLNWVETFIKKLKEELQEVQDHHGRFVLKESHVDLIQYEIDKLAGNTLTEGTRELVE